jgi:hypothetical protein
VVKTGYCFRQVRHSRVVNGSCLLNVLNCGDVTFWKRAGIYHAWMIPVGIRRTQRSDLDCGLLRLCSSLNVHFATGPVSFSWMSVSAGSAGLRY